MTRKEKILRQNRAHICGGIFIAVIVAIYGIIMLKNGNEVGVLVIVLSNFFALLGLAGIRDETK